MVKSHFATSNVLSHVLLLLCLVLSWWVNDRILKDHSLMRTCPRDDCSPIPDENLPDWVFSRPISEQVCPANEKRLFCVKREGNVYETAISWIGCTSVLYTTSTHKYTQKTGESGLLGHNEKKREGFSYMLISASTLRDLWGHQFCLHKSKCPYNAGVYPCELSS